MKPKKTLSQSSSAKAPAKVKALTALALLKRHATQSTRAGMARYGIPFDHALGVPMNKIQQVAKQLGRDHALAAALWETGVYEARLLASLVDDPDEVTPTQMEGWWLPFIERGARDDRNFVKKGVSWALRMIGRQSAPLHTAAVALARKLAASPAPAPRWIGKDALRELTSAAVQKRFS